MPRLLVLASTYPRWAGDTEPGFVHELNRNLARSFEVHVVCPHAPGALDEECLDGIWIHRFRYAPIQWETLVQGGGILNNLRHHPWKWMLVPGFFIGQYAKASRLLDRLSPNCVHAHWIIPQGLVLAVVGRFKGTLPPFMLTSHGGDLFGLRGRLFTQIKRIVLRKADVVTVVSRDMEREIRQLGVVPERVRVVSMGADFGTLFVPPLEKQRKPGEILFVGRLVEKKGLRYLIEALPAIAMEIPEAHLFVAGFGPEEPSLRAQVDRLGLGGRVTFLGPIKQAELPALYQRVALCVCPFIEASSGDQEGLPIVTLEAIACGCPVIVGDLAVLEDVFTYAESDFRVNPKQKGALALRVITVMRNHNNAVARTLAIRERLKDRFCWDTVADSYLRLLKGLLH